MLVENLKGRHHFVGIGVDGMVILKWVSNNEMFESAD
jgi:hypothetical protein